MSQPPQLGRFLWLRVDVDFEVCEVVNQRHSSREVRDTELDHVSFEAFWGPSFPLHHFPGAGVRVVWGEEVGHSAAEHSHQGTAVGEVQGQGSQLAHSVLLYFL